MRFTEQQLSEFVKLYERLDSPVVKAAFFQLCFEIACGRRLKVMPLHHGNITAIHLAFSADARPYADAEFAFSGSSAHMRWWFRAPVFDHGYLARDDVKAVLQNVGETAEGALTYDILTLGDTDAVLQVVDAAFENMNRLTRS